MQNGWRFSGIGAQRKSFPYREVSTQWLVLSEWILRWAEVGGSEESFFDKRLKEADLSQSDAFIVLPGFAGMNLLRGYRPLWITKPHSWNLLANRFGYRTDGLDLWLTASIALNNPAAQLISWTKF